MNMTPTKDQQAQEYAEKKIQGTIPECYLHDEHIYDADDIKDAYKQAYSDGYTACEQSALRISVAKLREVLESHFKHRILPSEIDEIINRVKKEI